MIYAGTMPARTPGEEGYNVVNMGDTGKGKWGRSFVKGHKSPGFLTRSNQAMLALGRYWEDAMPQGDKDYWIARATQTTFRCRDGNIKSVTGYSLFLKSNMAALVRKDVLVRLPELELMNGPPYFLPDEVAATTNQLRVWCSLWIILPEGHFIEYFVSAIHPHHVDGGQPMKFTQLIGKVIPSIFPVYPFPHPDPKYLSLPWDVNVGDKIGFHVNSRIGSRTGDPLWRADAWTPKITEIVAQENFTPF